MPGVSSFQALPSASHIADALLGSGFQANQMHRPSPTPPTACCAAMTLFYMAVSIALVLAWMVWRRYLWADQYFM